jgi:hypothetical protein
MAKEDVIEYKEIKKGEPNITKINYQNDKLEDWEVTFGKIHK